MFAQQLSRALSARGIHYAWFVAALTFLFSLAASTALTVPGVLMIPMSQEFGWNLGDISSAMALRLFLFGAIAPFAGALMVRYGLIRIMSISATLVVLGVLLAAMMTQKWQLWLSVGIILGIAPGMTALVVSATVASRWFTQRRGLVVGMLSAAVATGQLIFLPVAAWISEHYGWRAALMPTAIAVAVFGLLYVLFARNHPSDLGLPPYGEDKVLPPVTAGTGGAVAISFRALRRSAGVPAFWVLFGSFFVCGASSIGLMGPHRLANPAIELAQKLVTRRSFRRTGLPSGVVSTAATNGVLPGAPRPRFPPKRSPPVDVRSTKRLARVARGKLIRCAGLRRWIDTYGKPDSPRLPFERAR
jgi:MFS family permease